MIKAVLFDMDGTLVDSEKHYVEGTRDYLNKKGFDISDVDLFKIIGMTSTQTIDYLQDYTKLDRQVLIDGYFAYFMNENVINYSNYLYEDVEDTFRLLKEKGIKIVICSGSESFLIEQFLKESKLKDYVDMFLSSENMKHKPDPEIYLKAMEALHIDAKECIIIEDSYQGIKSGKNANCYVIARDASKYNINQQEADKIIKDLHEILEDII